MFLLPSEEKKTILRDLQIGFFAEWAETMPEPTNPRENYFKNKEGIEKCRMRFQSETKMGRMLGGVG